MSSPAVLPLQTSTEAARRWASRLALATAALALVLIASGGVVTSREAGLAVPDWPTTFGDNMFLFPLSGMVGDILYEHGHRLLGSAVGLLTILLAACLWRTGERHLQILGLVALVAVCLQGVLGGLRVIEASRNLAAVHGCFAQAFFALLATLVALTRPVLPGAPTPETRGSWRSLGALCVVMAAIIYSQIVSGAVVRHLALGLGTHLLLAMAVVVAVIAVTPKVITLAKADGTPRPGLTRPAWLLFSGIWLQLGLGFGSFMLVRAPRVSASEPILEVVLTAAHVTVGALLLALATFLAVRVARHARASSPADTRLPACCQEQAKPSSHPAELVGATRS